jgi:hypothetical protein
MDVGTVSSKVPCQASGSCHKTNKEFVDDWCWSSAWALCDKSLGKHRDRRVCGVGVAPSSSTTDVGTPLLQVSGSGEGSRLKRGSPGAGIGGGVLAGIVVTNVGSL